MATTSIRAVPHRGGGRAVPHRGGGGRSPLMVSGDAGPFSSFASAWVTVVADPRHRRDRLGGVLAYVPHRAATTTTPTPHTAFTPSFRSTRTSSAIYFSPLPPAATQGVALHDTAHDDDSTPTAATPLPSAVVITALPSLSAQLEYARDGHTVLRALLPPSFLSNTLRPALEAHGREHEVRAWQQKVAVAASSRPKISTTSTTRAVPRPTTVTDCRRVLRDVYDIPVDDLPFLQYFHCWRYLPDALALAHALAPVAATLLDVSAVRLYQDALFWKRRNDGPTPWHVDARMAPFDTSHIITLWIPLVPIPAADQGGTGLVFCRKSHADFALPYWHPVPRGSGNDDDDEEDDSSPWYHLEERYGIAESEHVDDYNDEDPSSLIDYMPLAVGDVTAHSGWTLHCANGNSDDGDDESDGNDDELSPRVVPRQDRLALAITYVDARAPIRPDVVVPRSSTTNNDDHSEDNGTSADVPLHHLGDNEDAWSYRDWVKDVPAGVPNFVHPAVPIVWPPVSRV